MHHHQGFPGFAYCASAWGDGGGSLGVRRPLRYLAYKLDLKDEQVSEIAKIIAKVKTERSQVDVDDRRAASAFADAVEGATFDEAGAKAAAAARVKSAERLRDVVVEALAKIHALLDDKQRKELAYLLRTGALLI